MKRIFLTIVLAIFMAGPANSQIFEAVFQQNPSDALPGSRQGGVAVDELLFQFMDGAPAIDVFSLRKGEHLQRIPLEGRKTWHCNNACVSGTYLHKGDKYPLIYVSQENRDEHCICVFRISGKKGSFAAEIVQKIILPTPVQMGLWYPNLVLDNDKGELYITGYSRESWKDARSGNGLQLLKFKLPDVSEGEIQISPAEILDRRVYDFRLATQGAVIKDGRMYQVYGMAGDSAIVCYYLENGMVLWAKDLTAAGIPNEPESLYFSGKYLYCTDVKGIVYRCKAL